MTITFRDAAERTRVNSIARALIDACPDGSNPVDLFAAIALMMAAYADSISSRQGVPVAEADAYAGQWMEEGADDWNTSPLRSGLPAHDTPGLKAAAYYCAGILEAVRKGGTNAPQ